MLLKDLSNNRKRKAVLSDHGEPDLAVTLDGLIAFLRRKAAQITLFRLPHCPFCPFCPVVVDRLYDFSAIHHHSTRIQKLLSQRGLIPYDGNDILYVVATFQEPDRRCQIVIVCFCPSVILSAICLLSVTPGHDFPKEIQIGHCDISHLCPPSRSFSLQMYCLTFSPNSA